jgi:hypothetical protein
VSKKLKDLDDAIKMAEIDARVARIKYEAAEAKHKRLLQQKECKHPLLEHTKICPDCGLDTRIYLVP